MIGFSFAASENEHLRDSPFGAEHFRLLEHRLRQTF